MRRLAAMTASALIVTTAVTACSTQVGRPSYSYTTAPCPDPNIPELGPSVNLGPNFTCGYLTVPENRDKPDGRKIRVAVTRAKAASETPKPDPIVYLTHGPGGIAFLDAVREVANGMNADREVIFVAQRGNYHSDPHLTCPEYDAFLDGTALSMKFSDPATGAQGAAVVKACRDRLAATGVDLASYNSAENAADIADLRVALGIKEWNVYGVSYGTDLAQWLLRDHPDGIRSMVLDSVSPVNQNIVKEGWPAAAGMYRALFDACARQPACAAAYPNLKEEFTATVNHLNQTPIVVVTRNPEGKPVKVNIDGYTLANLVVQQSYIGTSGFVKVPSMIHELANGDGSEAAAAMFARIGPPGLLGYGLAFGAYCREMVSWTNQTEVTSTGKAVLPEFPDEVLQLIPVLGRVFKECAVWDVGSATRAERAPAASDVPTLLMGGAFDGVTPAGWADVVAKNLRKSQVIPIPGAGHDVFEQSTCARSLMHAFIDNPTRPVDRACITSIAIPPFTTP
jgi:pimeloyl-ACP methyl ester carboxylesterase